MKAFLILEDGTVFTGTHIGADREVISEIVFNTSMAGYFDGPFLRRTGSMHDLSSDWKLWSVQGGYGVEKGVAGRFYCKGAFPHGK